MLASAEPPHLDVVPLLREAAEPLVVQALHDSKCSLLEAPEEAVLACAHPVWLGEVLINRLDNACRHGGQQITVRVTVCAGGGARNDAEGDGPGVPAEQVGRLFEPFGRGDRADLRLGRQSEAVGRPAFAGLRFTVNLSG